MAKIIALFSGQGSQYPGMGKELWENIPAVKEIYECASDILGFDVAKTSFEATKEELARTLVSQPVIFTLSVAAFAAAKDKMPAPQAVAGHSLGEFAALCCAGAFTMQDGFKIIKARAAAMDAAKSGGAMYAVLGSDEETIKLACGEAEGFAVPVNFNIKSQTVISGEEAAVEKAAKILIEKGAKAIKLGVSNAFHTKLMADAAAKFREDISNISFKAPNVDFYSNLTGQKHVISDYPAYFAEHMVNSVRFVEQVAFMTADGIDTCVEFGPGKTGATLVKKNNRAVKVMNVEDMAGLEALGKNFNE